ncbi:zinc finger protein 839 [Brachyhypopomus gauderio]|uniref:zinc finger protein 839 n=1 Tax=Brachyhypopomus gauderio TaxID=698409 RepID=UPI004041B95F
MADNEDESNNTSGAAAAEADPPGGSGAAAAEADPPGGSGSQVHVPTAAALPAEGEHRVEACSVKVCTVTAAGGGGGGQGPSESVHGGSGPDGKPADGCQEVMGQILGAEVLTSYVQAADNVEGAITTVSSEFLNALAPATTIIYVQPDGSFVESSGLSAEEQQQLIEQLSKQQLVQVTGSEAARIFEQTQSAKPPAAPSQAVKPGTISSIDMQQVIDHVNKSQVIAQTEPVRSHAAAPKILQRTVTAQPTSFITLEPGNLISSGGSLTATIQPQPFTIVQNASQQLQSVAKQVALQQSQNGAHLIHQKAVEPIHIQVQAPPKQEIKQRQTAPITILQPQSLPVSQSVVKVSTVGTVSTPQIIHITPVPGQQQYFLQNPGEPPIQLLLQKPAPVVSSISVPIVRKVQAPAPAPTHSPNPAKSPAIKPATVATPPTVILAPTPPTSVSSPTTKVLAPPTKVTTVVTKVSTPAVEKEKPRVKNRQKKPQKIQTRSGRVSRPPKHKVKDYKFIKNEDLAESHQSDSDDYSEISVEDEEGEEGKKKAEDRLNLRSKAFKCDVCEKSYIGLAGLNRHYRLNPTHERKQSPRPAEDDAKPTVELPVTEAPKTSPVKTTTTQKVQADSTRQIEPRRPGRPRGSGRPNLPKRLGRKPKRGRRGRPPKHHTAATAVTVEQQAQRQRARLTQFIQQYDDEDLIEIVLPRLAKVMTVWEFVLMKVEKGHPSKQQFPSVYREFEQLYSQVKKMAQEHFSIAPASRTAIEVNNMEVFKSLGITDPSSALTLLTSPQGQQGLVRPNQATKNLRNIENTKMLPPAKRFKMENCGGENNGSAVNQNGIQKEESSDGSAVVREPQVLLTRLENLTPEALVDGEASPNPDTAPGVQPEEEPMDTGDSVLNTVASKPQEDPERELSDVLASDGTVDIADEVKQLEQALSSDAEYKSAPQETVAQDVSCDPPQEGGMGEAGSTEEPVASQASLPVQAEEEAPVLIQTAEGLVRQSAEELASKGIVIVNEPDGTTMHIEAPEGVPLETVHALLGIETERKT